MAQKEYRGTIEAQGLTIGVSSTGDENDYISLSDIARYKSDDPSAVIANWMRNRDTLDFLGAWESLHNADFNSLEFEGIESQAGRNAFTISHMRDYATLHQLVVLANLESMNAELLKLGKGRAERAAILNRMAREQMTALLDNETLNRLLPGESERDFDGKDA